MEHLVRHGRSATLHIHANGALTFCGSSEEPDPWDEAPVVLAVEA